MATFGAWRSVDRSDKLIGRLCESVSSVEFYLWVEVVTQIDAHLEPPLAKFGRSAAVGVDEYTSGLGMCPSL